MNARAERLTREERLEALIQQYRRLLFGAFPFAVEAMKGMGEVPEKMSFALQSCETEADRLGIPRLNSRPPFAESEYPVAP